MGSGREGGRGRGWAEGVSVFFTRKINSVFGSITTFVYTFRPVVVVRVRFSSVRFLFTLLLLFLLREMLETERKRNGTELKT